MIFIFEKKSSTKKIPVTVTWLPKKKKKKNDQRGNHCRFPNQQTYPPTQQLRTTAGLKG